MYLVSPTFNTAAQPAQAVLPAAPVNPWAQPVQQQNVMPQPIAPMSAGHAIRELHHEMVWASHHYSTAPDAAPMGADEFLKAVQSNLPWFRVKDRGPSA